MRKAIDISDIHKDMLERGFTPQLIADEIVGVQPMPAYTGEIFKIRHNRLSWYKRFWIWFKKVFG